MAKYIIIGINKNKEKILDFGWHSLESNARMRIQILSMEYKNLEFRILKIT